MLGLSEGILGPHRRVTPHLRRDPRSPRLKAVGPEICVTPQISDKSCYGEHYKLEPLVGRDLHPLVFCGHARRGCSRKDWELANESDSSASGTHCESSLASRGFPRTRGGALAIERVGKRRAAQLLTGWRPRSRALVEGKTVFKF